MCCVDSNLVFTIFSPFRYFLFIENPSTESNTPGTSGGPGGRDRKLAVKKKFKKFQPQEFPPKWVKSKRRREKEVNSKVCNNNGIANATSGGKRKPPGPIVLSFIF